MYKLTHDVLLSVLDFDPETGIFVWKVTRSNRVKPGSRAGVFHRASGGRYISISNEKFMAHRLAFFYINGRWPNTDVRPLDGDYDNCAIANLREVSRVELAHEREKVATNTSGFAGVSRAKHGKWQAKITWNYEQINLGAGFETADDASEMYDESSRRLMAGVATKEDRERVVAELRTWRRQRTAWKHLNRTHEIHAWSSFEEFCSTVGEFPEARYAMVAIDMAKPIGPSSFRWTLPLTAERGLVGIEYNRATRSAKRDHNRDKDFRKKYGIDFAEYQRMLIAQKGVCAICEQPETKLQNGSIRMLSVDHNHKTGAVRGLLCANCNMAIGYACDDVSILQKAIGYLRRWSASAS
jgi:hypothetical protein